MSHTAFGGAIPGDVEHTVRMGLWVRGLSGGPKWMASQNPQITGFEPSREIGIE
ncbi:hypothetical protein [Microbulbifer epialgicus]|uniref:Uncharacterized protein n=1 Tax=Microbulbifer epialgicus TaxID=393907 RepID=A0ABV4P6T7_9GAMM